MFDKFKKDDFVFIHSTEGEGVGNFEINRITNVNPGKMDLKYPLVHTYRDDFQNHSQVVRIPQYSTVTIEKDIQLFHKARKEGLGGVIVLMANAGFTIKGYVADSSLEATEELRQQKMKKSKAGVFFGLANYDGNIARKVFDLKFTTKYPTITLPQDQSLTVINTKKEYPAGKFQHITIPPDLNLHLTDERVSKDYLFFRPSRQLIGKDGFFNKKYKKLVTVTYPTINQCPIFTNKQYAACFMVAFARMPHWNTNSYFTMELFVLQNESVRVPIGVHKKGELGVLHPIPCHYIDDSSGQTIKYFLQPFIVMSHFQEKAVQVEFW